MTPSAREEFWREGAIIATTPGRYLIGWGHFQRHSFKPEGSAFYLQDFFLSQKKPWITFANTLEITTLQLQEILHDLKKSDVFVWKIHQEERFQKEFAQLQNLLRRKTLIKAVPYLSQWAEGKIYPQNILWSALQRSSKGFLYGCWNESQGIVGISPEILFKKDGHSVFSQAVAGTGLKEELQTPKMLNEHCLVVQGIVNALKPFGKVTSGSMQYLELPHFTHLLTPIHLETQTQIDFERLVHILHPTPALGAVPSDLGNKWLKSYNRHFPRFYYGAPVGFVHASQCSCYVAIRNLQWAYPVAMMTAGCGVVAESSAQNERREIAQKLASIQEMLGL